MVPAPTYKPVLRFAVSIFDIASRGHLLWKKFSRLLCDRVIPLWRNRAFQDFQIARLVLGEQYDLLWIAVCPLAAATAWTL